MEFSKPEQLCFFMKKIIAEQIATDNIRMDCQLRRKPATTVTMPPPLDATRLSDPAAGVINGVPPPFCRDIEHSAEASLGLCELQASFVIAPARPNQPSPDRLAALSSPPCHQRHRILTDPISWRSRMKRPGLVRLIYLRAVLSVSARVG